MTHFCADGALVIVKAIWLSEVLWSRHGPGVSISTPTLIQEMTLVTSLQSTDRMDAVVHGYRSTWTTKLANA